MKKLKNFFANIFDDFWGLFPARLFILVLICSIAFSILFFIDGYKPSLKPWSNVTANNSNGKINPTLLEINLVTGSEEDYVFHENKERPSKTSTINIKGNEYNYNVYNSYKLDVISYGYYNISEGYKIDFNFNQLNSEEILKDQYQNFTEKYKTLNPYLFAYESNEKYINCINFRESEVDLFIKDNKGNSRHAFNLSDEENWKTYINNNESIFITDVDGTLFTGIISLNLVINLKVEILDKETLETVGYDINYSNYLSDLNNNYNNRSFLIPVTGLDNKNVLELIYKDKLNRFIITQDEKLYFEDEMEFNIITDAITSNKNGIPSVNKYEISEFKIYYVDREKNKDIEIPFSLDKKIYNGNMNIKVDSKNLKSGYYKIKVSAQAEDSYEYWFTYYFEKEGEE